MIHYSRRLQLACEDESVLEEMPDVLRIDPVNDQRDQADIKSQARDIHDDAIVLQQAMADTAAIEHLRTTVLDKTLSPTAIRITELSSAYFYRRLGLTTPIMVSTEDAGLNVHAGGNVARGIGGKITKIMTAIREFLIKMFRRIGDFFSAAWHYVHKTYIKLGIIRSMRNRLKQLPDTTSAATHYLPLAGFESLAHACEQSSHHTADNNVIQPTPGMLALLNHTTKVISNLTHLTEINRSFMIEIDEATRRIKDGLVQRNDGLYNIVASSHAEYCKRVMGYTQQYADKLKEYEIIDKPFYYIEKGKASVDHNTATNEVKLVFTEQPAHFKTVGIAILSGQEIRQFVDQLDALVDAYIQLAKLKDSIEGFGKKVDGMAEALVEVASRPTAYSDVDKIDQYHELLRLYRQDLINAVLLPTQTLGQFTTIGWKTLTAITRYVECCLTQYENTLIANREGEWSILLVLKGDIVEHAPTLQSHPLKGSVTYQEVEPLLRTYCKYYQHVNAVLAVPPYKAGEQTAYRLIVPLAEPADSKTLNSFAGLKAYLDRKIVKSMMLTYEQTSYEEILQQKGYRKV